MKITHIHIGKFKNLISFDLDCSKHNGLSVIIGNNGSGKSNLIEAISDIFYSKYTSVKSTVKQYDIKYLDFSGRSFDLNEHLSPTLPKRIVAIYSGEEDRMWQNYYKPQQDFFISSIHKTGYLDYPTMIYINRNYWGIALLALLLSDAPDVVDFIKNQLDIQKVDKIVIKLNKTLYEDYKINPVINFLKEFDSQEEFTVDEFKTKLSGTFDSTFDGSFDTGYSAEDIFQNLYTAYAPEKDKRLLTDLEIEYNGGLSITDLSEGQKKQLLIKAAFEFAGQEDTLFLLDEPDAHVHISNKKSILDIIEPYRNNRHIIITTHSPTLCKYLAKENIVPLENGEIINIKDEFEAAKLLVDNNDIFKLLFSTKDILITEGKTDIQYISKAIHFFKTDYPELLNIDFLMLGGTDGENAKLLFSKIRELPNRKVILLVDRDDGGIKCSRTVLNNNNLKKADIDYRKISIDRNLYVLMLPTISGGQQTDFVIEDYFKQDKLIELTKKEIDDEFNSTKTFTQFPKVKQDLKEKLLPEFCDHSAASVDMEDFKTLLNKLKEIINLP